MNIDGIEEKESADDNHSEEDGDLSERHCNVLTSGLKVDTATQIEKQGEAKDADVLVETEPVRHQQQISNGNLAFWERFLNVSSIKVLLVENDDSTRYVVTALLRNCNYEVLNAANGVQAWKILEDLSTHVDIILTEVVMPTLSGIGLLHKIMSHKTRKNTPVIMMSSHDSMGLIFKCLSRGAVDFLVKPIRKNELKILWQHVWRRCHSSSGSGSESGTQAQKCLKSNSSEKSGDNGENDGSDGQNTSDGSDDGSGAQSSWTGQAVEVDSSRALSPTDHIAKCADSTCAQVIPSNAEKIDKMKVQACLSRDSLQHKQHDNAAENDKDLDTIAQTTVETKHGDPETEPNNSSLKVPDSMTEVANRININCCNDDGKESSVEVSLKRLRGVQDAERYPQEDRCVLRRSEQSAFSRYNTSTNGSKTPNEITGSSTVIDNSMDAAKRESAEGNIHLHQFSYGVSNTVGMGSTTAKLPKNNCEGTSTVNGFNPSAFKPVEYELGCSQQQASLPDGVQTTDTSSGSKQIRYPNTQDYSPSNCHFIMDQPSSNHPESSSMKLTVDASLCGSSNALSRAMDVEERHYGFDKSNSGSNHASNGATGSNPGTNTAGNNAESGVDQAGKSGNGDASGSVSGNRDDESRLKRAAAMIKLRQKRKERGFQKKVQYQNRKKLAEQRPRVRGQFAKRTETDSSHRTRDDEL